MEQKNSSSIIISLLVIIVLLLAGGITYLYTEVENNKTALVQAQQQKIIVENKPLPPTKTQKQQPIDTNIAIKSTANITGKIIRNLDKTLQESQTSISELSNVLGQLAKELAVEFKPLEQNLLNLQQTLEATVNAVEKEVVAGMQTSSTTPKDILPATLP